MWMRPQLAQVRKPEPEQGQEGEPVAGSADSSSFSFCSAALVPWPWLCVGELFLDILGPMGTLLPQLWGGSAASSTSISTPWAWWTLVP